MRIGLEQYLSLIHETDDAVSWLVDYLSNLDRKCVLVFFGDHMPALSDGFYIEMHGGEYTYLDEEELKRSVPFFVWTNYDIENEPVELTSLNYLSKYMFEAAGIELPAYNKFLADVEEEIPAINALGYYSKSEGRFKTYEEALDEEAKLLNTYHQFIYNCLFDKENRNSFFFPRLNQDP